MWKCIVACYFSSLFYPVSFPRYSQFRSLCFMFWLIFRLPGYFFHCSWMEGHQGGSKSTLHPLNPVKFLLQWPFLDPSTSYSTQFFVDLGERSNGVCNHFTNFWKTLETYWKLHFLLFWKVRYSSKKCHKVINIDKN